MPRPRAHDDALRARLLDVTSEVIATAGADAVTVRDVASRAGTSSSAVYALFGSRAALVHQVAEEGFRRFGEHLAAVPRTADAGADLLALGLAYRASALADPHFYRVMFAAPSPAGRAPAPATERATFRVLRDAAARLLTDRDAGAALDDAAAAAQEAALALWALVHGLVSLELAGLAPGTADERAARYERTLRSVGRAAFA